MSLFSTLSPAAPSAHPATAQTQLPPPLFHQASDRHRLQPLKTNIFPVEMMAGASGTSLLQEGRRGCSCVPRRADWIPDFPTYLVTLVTHVASQSLHFVVCKMGLIVCCHLQGGAFKEQHKGRFGWGEGGDEGSRGFQ